MAPPQILAKVRGCWCNSFDLRCPPLPTASLLIQVTCVHSHMGFTLMPLPGQTILFWSSGVAHVSPCVSWTLCAPGGCSAPSPSHLPDGRTAGKGMVRSAPAEMVARSQEPLRPPRAGECGLGLCAWWASRQGWARGLHWGLWPPAGGTSSASTPSFPVSPEEAEVGSGQLLWALHQGPPFGRLACGSAMPWNLASLASGVKSWSEGSRASGFLKVSKVDCF